MMRSSASALDRMVSEYSRCCGRQVGVEQQPGHADDAVHRRADFVAHVGEEFRLEPHRLERDVARLRELGGDLFARADVALDRRLLAQGHLVQ